MNKKHQNPKRNDIIIKNNLNNKEEKQIYSDRIHELEKYKKNIVYNLFKKEKENPNFIRFKNKYSPSIIKNPERIYLKELEEMKSNYLKTKSYDKRTGLFDSNLFNSKNNFYTNSYYNTVYFPTESHHNSSSQQLRFRTLKYNDYLDYCLRKKLNKNSFNYKKFSKSKNNLVKNDNFFFTSLSINNTKPELTRIENDESQNKSKNKNDFNAEKKLLYENKILTKKIEAYLLKYKRNKLKKVKSNLLLKSKSQFKNNKKSLMNKILYLFNDPLNPYSINFSTSILKNLFNLDFHYKKFELGVPSLRTKKINKTLDPISKKAINRMNKFHYDNLYSNRNIKKDKSLHYKLTQSYQNISRKKMLNH